MHFFIELSGRWARRSALVAVTVFAAVLTGCGGGGGSDTIGVPTPTQIAAAQASLDDTAVSSDSIAAKQAALDAVEAPTPQ
jgi:hypothetical protein